MAESVSPLTGLEESHREMSFLCGIEGVTGDAADAFEAAVLQVITEVAEHGSPLRNCRPFLHQIEMSQREVGGDGMPYGLQLIFSCLSAAIHRGGPRSNCWILMRPSRRSEKISRIPRLLKVWLGRYCLKTSIESP